MGKGRELKATVVLEGKTSKSLKAAFENAGRMGKNTETSLNSVMKKFGGFAASAAKAVATGFAAAGAAVTAFGVSATKVGMDFESAMSQVSATMLLDKSTERGLKDFETLENAAREMGRETAFSASEAAEALNYLALAGYDAEKAAAALPTVLHLAGAGAMDLAQASDMVTDSMSALGIAATKDNLETFADKLAMTASKSNTSVAQLGEAILTVGGTAKGMAGGVTELNAALGVLADNGIKAAEGGTHLRNMMLSLQEARSTEAGSLMKSLGLDEKVYDEAGNLRNLGDTFNYLNEAMRGMSAKEVNSTLSTIFKVTDLGAARAMLAGTANDIDSLGKTMDAALLEQGKSLDSLGISLQSLSDEYHDAFASATISQDDFINQMTSRFDLTAEEAGILFGGLQSLASETGTRFKQLEAEIGNSAGAAERMYAIQQDNLKGDVADLHSALDDFKISFFKAIEEPLRDAAKFGQRILGDLSTALTEGGFSGLSAKLGEMFMGGLGSAVSMIRTEGPGMLSDAISAVFGMSAVDSGALVQNGLEAVGSFISGVKTGISAAAPVVESVWKTITGTFQPLIEGMIPLVGGLFDMLATRAGLVVEAAQRFSPLLNSIANTLMPAFTATGQALGGVLGNLGSVISNNIVPGLEHFAGTMMGIGQNILTAVTPVIERISTFIQTIVPVLGPALQQWHSLLGALFQNVLVPIGDFLANKIGQNIMDVVNIVGMAVNQVLGFLEPILPAVITYFTGIITFLTGVFTGDWTKAWEGIKTVFTGIWEAMKGIVKSVLNTIINGVNSVINGLNGIVTAAGDVIGIHIKIPTIPTFATGGTVTSPTLAVVGEGGAPETIIPHTNTAESRRLLATAAQGVLGTDTVIKGGDNDGRTFNITYSPVIQGSGITDQELRKSFEEFKRYMVRFTKEQMREAWA